MLAYSALNKYPKVTLPSVEAWNGNTNITKDPPRSITTRKKDRVGQTSYITDEIDGSSDRILDNIRQFARGVNPAVSVEYSNLGNTSSTSRTGEAFLPYRIMKDGAFRPPLFRQEDLTALSRQRRPYTEVPSTIQFIDFSKRLFTSCQEEKKTIRDESFLIKDVKANNTYNIKDTIVENFEVKHVLKNRNDISGSTNLSGTNFTGHLSTSPNHSINIDSLKGDIQTNHAQTNLQSIEFSVDLNPKIKNQLVGSVNTNTSGYTKDQIDESKLVGNAVHHKVNATANTNLAYNTNKTLDGSKNVNGIVKNKRNMSATTNISHLEKFDNENVNAIHRTKNPIKVEYNTQIGGNETRHEYIHKDIEKERKMAHISVTTPTVENIYKNVSSTEKYIKPTLGNFGSFDTKSGEVRIMEHAAVRLRPKVK